VSGGRVTMGGAKTDAEGSTWEREHVKKTAMGGAPVSGGCSVGLRTFFQTQPAKMTELCVS